jgi:hypothetical protein
MSESVRQRFSRWQLEDVLLKYPGLRLCPSTQRQVTIAGALAFNAEAAGKEGIEDEYDIELSVPEAFPKAMASVREMAGRIQGSYHKFRDGSLCLGSPTRLRFIMDRSPSLFTFVERCLIPYLYGHSYFEKYGVLSFGELKHGPAGIRQDLASLLGFEREDTVCGFVRLTSMRKRDANKYLCPCGSNLRLGRCHNKRVNALRSKFGRNWFRVEYSRLV